LARPQAGRAGHEDADHVEVRREGDRHRIVGRRARRERGLAERRPRALPDVRVALAAVTLPVPRIAGELRGLRVPAGPKVVDGEALPVAAKDLAEALVDPEGGVS